MSPRVSRLEIVDNCVPLDAICPDCHGRGVVEHPQWVEHQALSDAGKPGLHKPDVPQEIDCEACRGAGLVAHRNLDVLWENLEHYYARMLNR